MYYWYQGRMIQIQTDLLTRTWALEFNLVSTALSRAQGGPGESRLVVKHGVPFATLLPVALGMMGTILRPSDTAPCPPDSQLSRPDHYPGLLDRFQAHITALLTTLGHIHYSIFALMQLLDFASSQAQTVWLD